MPPSPVPFNLLTSFDGHSILVDFHLREGFVYRVERRIIDPTGRERSVKSFLRMAHRDHTFVYHFQPEDQTAYRIEITEEIPDAEVTVRQYGFIVTKEYVNAMRYVDRDSEKEAGFNKALTGNQLISILNGREGNLPIDWKDAGGEIDSRSEGKIKGFYLGTRLADDGNALRSSPFGDNLIFFPHNTVIGVNANLYFNGFYCYFGEGTAHYASLVLANNGSRNDRNSGDLFSCGYLCSGEKLFVEVFVCDRNLSIRGKESVAVRHQDRMGYSNAPNRRSNCAICY